MGKFKNLKGQCFGRLLVIGDSGRRANGSVMWVCYCECGKFSTVQSDNLKSKNTRSCGCLKKDHIRRMGKASFKHGDSTGNRPVRIYRIWIAMRQRCNDKNAKRFKRYGGRGIGICPEWGEYIVFKKWALNTGYADTLTIDRIDNDKGYYPGNCQWLTQSENSRKKSNKNYEWETTE